jgi:hypothetical protein
MASEQITLTKEILMTPDPRLTACYARGSVFKREGKYYRVEKGARSVVHRALCLTHYYGSRCAQCPNGKTRVELAVLVAEEEPTL